MNQAEYDAEMSDLRAQNNASKDTIDAAERALKKAVKDAEDVEAAIKGLKDWGKKKGLQ
jgi:hypothetical protein